MYPPDDTTSRPIHEYLKSLDKGMPQKLKYRHGNHPLDLTLSGQRVGVF